MASWTNWAGTEAAEPDRVVAPHAVEELIAEVEHGISAPVDTMIRPDHFVGVVALDRDAMTVTTLAGTPLHLLNAQLARLGLSLHNMGDIAEQTLAAATSTGTHGTGGTVASLSAQIDGFTIISGHG